MNASDVADVILLNTLLAVSQDTPSLIARLIDWKNGVNYDEPAPSLPKAKAGKASKPEPSPDPSNPDDPGF